MASALTHRAGFRQARASALAVALLLAVRAGSAEPIETEPIRLEYTAPSGCPDASDFSRRVFERTSKARPAGDAEPARTFVVAIEPAAAGMQGSLVVRQDGMSTVARSVSGKNCDEVARALALATSLAIDPEAALGVPESQGADKSGTVAGASANTLEPRREDPEHAADEPPTTKPTSPVRNDRRAALLVGPSAAFGPSPNPAFGASAAFEWSSPSPVMLPSALGLELTVLTSAEHSVAGAGSSFDFVFARPYVCTLGLALGAKFGIVPCIGAELGAVIASGSEIASPATETRFWAAGELALRFDIALSDDWFADATASLVLPFSRYQFVFRTPETSIYDVPAVTAAFGLRIGRRF